MFQLVNYIREVHGLNSYESRDEYNAFDDPILSECVYRPPMSKDNVPDEFKYLLEYYSPEQIMDMDQVNLFTNI